MKQLTAMAAAILLVGLCSASSAQTTVTLPDTSQTTTLTATVSAQARVTLPAGVTFNVTDIGSSTAASAASVTIDRIAMASATNQLKISLQANAANFTPPVGGATTWSAGDVTWNAATWATGTGSSGTLSNSSYNTVATSDADAVAMSSTTLVFTLAAKTTVKRSGNHTLVMTWKIEAI